MFAEKPSDGGMLTFHVLEPSLFTEELAGDRSIFHFFMLDSTGR